MVGNRYLLGDVLGEGGVGVVYRARDLRSGCEVAIKMVQPDLQNDAFATSHLRAEIQAGHSVHHPNLVSVLDTGTSLEHGRFIVMELVRGRSLGALAHEPPISISRLAEIMRQLLAALQTLHAAGFVHGDIKSDNVLVDDAGGTDWVKLIDLGLGRKLDELYDVGNGNISGTAEYMAPEVALGGGPSPSSDLYAAGVILYELLTGTTPFAGGPPDDILCRQVNDEVVTPSLRCPDCSIPRALEEVVMRALAKDPDARHRSAAVFAAAIAVATSSGDPVATVDRSRSPFSTTSQTHDWNAFGARTACAV